MVKQVSAGFVIFRGTKDGPKFLLLFDRGRDWNFPRGKLVAEEKSFYGALRETQEETGLRRQDLRIKRGFRAYERFTFLNRDRVKVHKTIIFYLAETNKKQIELSREHDGFGWFLYGEATTLLSSYKERRAVLKKANDFISEGRPTVAIVDESPHRWSRRRKRLRMRQPR
ncbi:MAG: hypothetical protein A3C03_01180 [Candidatus Colwellbacteria bacterium RIFCSPHIGHO2_02_FULL_45_17]|uniref:Nudix hydrolase domain-containing protein n=1 Tax=Candidatus Colwellbacteria bacterium RIFCSPLOWO2_02_FULL_45_11 TaxID=1797692 RepID=A0A1G1Z820_9BACT|nr:MAG: hypothetical protein A3C03_01180 [Candidatus Colwellbacteria bacterium RIFCSPHIGHO2_02_FULL_45_17]OGY60785.1 MAG: hypothetical protein A3I33_02405 [Candidatus Colwellbacteria bacterium RIFCSPLOWO2_02_FULL_45_11]